MADGRNHGLKLLRVKKTDCAPPDRVVYPPGRHRGRDLLHAIHLQADVGDVSGLLRDYDSNVIGWGYFSSFGFTGDYFALTDTTNLDVTLHGAVTLEGADAVVPVELDLRVHSGVGVTDFGDTIGFSFATLPPGVSFSSASGQFLKGTAVPEPGSILNVLVGLMAILLVRQRGGPVVVPQRHNANGMALARTIDQKPRVCCRTLHDIHLVGEVGLRERLGDPTSKVEPEGPIGLDCEIEICSTG